MDDAVSSMIQSSKIIKAPTGEAAMSFVNESTTAETNIPLVADTIDLGQFYLPQAGEMVHPDTLNGVKSKVDAITQYVRDSVNSPSEEAFASFLNDILTTNEWNNLKPLDKLEKLFSYVDLQRRATEIKSQKELYKHLKEQLYA